VLLPKVREQRKSPVSGTEKETLQIPKLAVLTALLTTALLTTLAGLLIRLLLLLAGLLLPAAALLATLAALLVLLVALIGHSIYSFAELEDNHHCDRTFLRRHNGEMAFITKDRQVMKISSGKAAANERRYPYIVQLTVPGRLLDIGLSRRIIDFHKARHVQLRHGRTIPKKRQNETCYRWCFSDHETARAFIEQFGGTTI
jgi:hypothetical protein